MKKIIITGDFSRIKKGELEQLKNIQWLFNMLQTPISFTTDTSIEMFPNENEIPLVHEILNQIGIYGSESWINRYDSDIIDGETKKLLESIFEESLVISLETPYWLLKFLKTIECEVIDLIFHPVRYMQDLLLGFASENQNLVKVFKEFAVPTFNLYSEASMIKAYNARMSQDSFFRGSSNCLLFTGQMDIDRSIVDRFKLKNIYEYEDTLKEEFLKYDYIFYKPHPYMSHNTTKSQELVNQVSFLKDIAGDNLIITNKDFYWLMSQSAIKKTVSLSSGTGIESKFFGLESMFLYKYPWAVDGNHKSDTPFYYALDQSFLYPSFWKKVLESLCSVKDVIYNERYQKNKLRTTLMQSWGFSLQNIGSEMRLWNIDTENRKLSDENTKQLTLNMKEISERYSKLDIEFDKASVNKVSMQIFLENLLRDLDNKENKRFVLKKLFNDKSVDDIALIDEKDIYKLLRFVGKFGQLNRLDIERIINKQRGEI